MRTLESATPVDPDANACTRRCLTLLGKLAEGEFPRMLSGAFSIAAADALAAASGSAPALLGVEYCRGFGIPPVEKVTETIDWKTLNPGLIAHAQAGGMIRVLTHLPNPCNEKYGGLRDNNADITAILTAGTPARGRWLALIDELAAGFNDLASHGVSVIFGPLHEMNCNGFWWGATPQRIGVAGYVELWRDLQRELTHVRGCHNLLWLFAALGHDPFDAAIYPGDDVVDLVGLDVYDPCIANHTDRYHQLCVYEKPFVLSEYGPLVWNAPEQGYDHFDCRRLPADLAQHWPRTAAFMFWGGHFAATAHHHFEEMMADPRVITREELATGPLT